MKNERAIILKIGNAQLNIFCTALLSNTALTQLQINLFLVAWSKFLVLTQLKLTWFLFWLFLIRSCKLAFSRRVGVRQSNLTQPNLTWWPFLQPPPPRPEQFITHFLGETWGVKRVRQQSSHTFATITWTKTFLFGSRLLLIVSINK